MIIGGKKKAVSLKTAARSREFKPLKVSPQMQAAYERCSDTRVINPASESQVHIKHELARVYEVPAVRRKR